MSYNYKVSAPKTMQKFCKVCQDAGKTEAEYRSHFIRETPDPSSNVICPTLLALECRYCYKNGHTVKYCPEIKNKKPRESFQSTWVERGAKPTSENTQNVKKNTFGCLEYDTDEEESNVSVNETMRENFPALCSISKSPVVIKGNYASALTTPVPVPKVVRIPVPKLEQEPEKYIKTSAVPLPYFKGPFASKMDWTAFDTDSEEEEEEGYESEQEEVLNMSEQYDDDW